LVQEAVTAMGGAEKLRSIQTLSMKDGTGTRTRLGQTVRTSDAEMPAQLTKVAEIVDLANARASLDYELGLGPFMMHRHEILTRLGEGAAGKPVGIEIVDMRPTSNRWSWRSSPSRGHYFKAICSSRALVPTTVRRRSISWNPSGSWDCASRRTWEGMVASGRLQIW
jgi:hypothetical protein